MMKAVRLLAVLLLVWSAGARVACHAAGSKVTLAQYDSALKAVRDNVQAASSAVDNGNDISGEMPGAFAKHTIGTISSVRMPGGSLQPVDTKSLVKSIAAVDKISDDDDQVSGYSAVTARIDFLRGELKAEVESTEKPIPPDKARAVARKILSGPAYASDPVPPPSWSDRETEAFEKWAGNLLNKLFRRRGPNINPPNINWGVLMWVFFSILIAALFVLLVWIIAQIIGRRQARTRVVSLTSTEKAILEARDKDTLLSLAERHAKSGDYRAAFRLVYLATLIVLDTGGVLRFDRSKTNWEYVRQLRNTGRQDVYDVLVPLTREFDRVWYGLSPAGPEVYRRAVTDYEKLTETPKDKAVAVAM